MTQVYDTRQQQLVVAALKGVPVAGYAKSALAAAVAKDIAEQEFLNLSLKDREAFAKAIIEPVQPSAASIEAAREYKERFGL